MSDLSTLWADAGALPYLPLAAFVLAFFVHAIQIALARSSRFGALPASTGALVLGMGLIASSLSLGTGLELVLESLGDDFALRADLVLKVIQVAWVPTVFALALTALLLLLQIGFEVVSAESSAMPSPSARISRILSGLAGLAVLVGFLGFLRLALHLARASALGLDVRGFAETLGRESTQSLQLAVAAVVLALIALASSTFVGLRTWLEQAEPTAVAPMTVDRTPV